MDDFDETAGKHKDSVVSAFDGMDTDIGDEFTSAAQLAMSAWDGVAEYFAGVASDIRESILSAAAQVTFTTPTQVKQHAYGGITTQPTLSTLSEDGGKEYIIPINKPKRALELMMGAAQDLMGSLGGAGGSERMMRSDSQVVKQDIKNTVTAPATINIYESNNPKTTAQEVNNRFEEHIYDSTKGVFSI